MNPPLTQPSPSLPYWTKRFLRWKIATFDPHLDGKCIFLFWNLLWLPNSAIRSNHRIKSENETITGNNFSPCQPSKYHVLMIVWRHMMMRIFSILFSIFLSGSCCSPKKGAKKCNNGRYSKTITRDNYQCPTKSCFHIREGIINLI